MGVGLNELASRAVGVLAVKWLSIYLRRKALGAHFLRRLI